jgi:transcriptional regulator with XRE-family HTH domain
LTKSVFTPTYARFRELLIEAREDAGLTQSQLADRLNKPQSYVSKFERGERRLDVVEFLEVARAIKTDPFRLLKTPRIWIAKAGGFLTSCVSHG